MKSCVFLTNHMDLGATTIAAIYKDRWQIEIFFQVFETEPQNQDLCGYQPNAVKIQIWTALIAMLMLRYLQLWFSICLVAFESGRLSLRMNLFTHRDLWAWLNGPYETPPIFYEAEQLTFNLGIILTNL